MAGERYRAICALHLFLVEEGKILLSRRFNTGYEDRSYSVPAGHLESNEPVTAGMAREVGEEIGVTIQPEDLDVIHVMHRNAGHGRVDFFFTAKKWRGNPENKEPDKCDELKWANPNDLPENMVPYVRHAIVCFMRGVYFSEFGWDGAGEPS